MVDGTAAGAHGSTTEWFWELWEGRSEGRSEGIPSPWLRTRRSQRQTAEHPTNPTHLFIQCQDLNRNVIFFEF